MLHDVMKMNVVAGTEKRNKVVNGLVYLVRQCGSAFDRGEQTESSVRRSGKSPDPISVFRRWT